MAGVMIPLCIIYALIIFLVFVFSFRDKNPKSYAWYALFDAINIIYALAFLVFRQDITGDSENLGTAILGTYLIYGILMLSVVAEIVHAVRSRRHAREQSGTSKAYRVLLLCLLPLAVVGVCKIGEGIFLAGADLVLVEKNYNGWVESSRTNLIVKNNECIKNQSRLSMSSGWKYTYGEYWNVGENETFSKSEYSSDYGLQPSKDETNIMRAIIKDVGVQAKSIRHIKGTNYYIAGGYIYRDSQRICATISPDDIYYRK